MVPYENRLMYMSNGKNPMNKNVNQTVSLFCKEPIEISSLETYDKNSRCVFVKVTDGFEDCQVSCIRLMSSLNWCREIT